MEARCPNGDQYLFYLDKWVEVDAEHPYLVKQLSGSPNIHIYTEIYGTQWTSLCEGYDIEEGDVVKFAWNEDLHLFNVEVTNKHNVAKPLVQHTGMLVCARFLTH